MKKKYLLFFLINWSTFFLAFSVVAQDGLEGIIIEEYYVSDDKDSTDILSGQHLKPGTKTYRIYADLAPEYKLQVVYATEGHPWKIESTTSFFNNYRGGFGIGSDISRLKIKEHTVPLDSWITIGNVSQHYFGVLKELDPDGSVIGGENNDGGSAMIEGGLLTNEDPWMGIPLTESDGYISKDKPDVRLFNLVPDAFVRRENDGSFILEDGAITVVEGVLGVGEENHVLLAQITTEGEISFEFNMQLIAPYGGPENFVARNPDGTEFTHPDLIYPKVTQ